MMKTILKQYAQRKSTYEGTYVLARFHMCPMDIYANI